MILEFEGSPRLEERWSWMKDVQDLALKTQDKSQDDMFITSSTVIRGFMDDDAEMMIRTKDCRNEVAIYNLKSTGIKTSTELCIDNDLHSPPPPSPHAPDCTDSS